MSGDLPEDWPELRDGAQPGDEMAGTLHGDDLRRHGDPVWGPLSFDREALADKLGEATRAVYDAAITAQYRTESGYPLASPLSTVLAGLSQAIDGLLEQLAEPSDDARVQASTTTEGDAS